MCHPTPRTAHRTDHHTATVDGAAAWEAWQAEDEWDDTRPTLGELDRDEAGYE